VKPLSLRTRLAFFYSVVFALLLAGFAAVFYQVLAFRLEKAFDQELIERAAALRGYLRFDNGQPSLAFDATDPDEGFFIRTATRYFQVYDLATGKLLTQSSELRLIGLEYNPDEAKSLATRPGFNDVGTDQGKLRFYNQLIHGPDGKSYLVQLGSSTQSIDEALESFAGSLVWIIPGGALLAAISGWWLAARALKPVRSIAEAARQITATHLGRRLPIRGSRDELDYLAEAFNETLERLQNTLAEMRQFTGSIAHELRTPLATLRAEAELALMHPGSDEELRRVLASQLEEFEKLTRLINQLLLLARAEAGEFQILKQPVPLGAVARSVSEQMLPLAAAKNISIRLETDAEVTISGDRNWMDRVAVNLLDNAIKFTPDGGEIEVVVRREQSSGCLQVRDTGEGMSAEALPHIFERFYRADPARSREVQGAGLGLSLVQWVVEQHEGRVEVQSELHKGSCFTVRLPLASS
jgi:two-component system OmpR family sensor kinase